MKSLPVIRMFSEHSFGISNLVMKFLPMVGAAYFWSSSSPLVSLFSLSFFIIKFSLWVSPTATHWTKIFIDVPVDGAGLRLSGGLSNVQSVQPNNEFPPCRCFPAEMSTCWMLCVSLSSACRPCIHSTISLFYLALF